MHDRELYRRIPGIEGPWTVAEIQVDLDEGTPSLGHLLLRVFRLNLPQKISLIKTGILSNLWGPPQDSISVRNICVRNNPLKLVMSLFLYCNE